MSYELAIYTLYDHPSDFPDHYVIRRFTFDKEIKDPIPDKEIFYKADTLMECRRKMVNEMGLVCMARSSDDDPVIIESYI